MSYSIIVLPPFERELKRLSKKHPSLKADYAIFIDDLTKNPLQGTPLGKDCYKIRLAITSKQKGKSGGARIITCLKLSKSKIFLMAIYDKSEKENISENELDKLLKIIAETL
ncbi:MAG: type II toxin-antitoxin system RelE/ParE family toxin [Bacteroidia bacterium]|nr:type II toxin-antitoxin system RelE/ParE family toxin [Bacteroidia bacterium]